jgi:hypothetical protein
MNSYLMNNKYEEFLECQNKSIFEIISKYFDTSNEVMFGRQFSKYVGHVCDQEAIKADSDFIEKIIKLLLDNIQNWAKEKSPIYLWPKEIITKNDLEDKQNWYVGEISDFMVTGTSGSTTGHPFEYLRYNPVFDKIEWENHYDMVLDEFEVPDRPNILFFLPHSYDTDGDKFIACSGGRSPSNFVNHGSKRDPIVHHVNFELYKQRQEDFYAHLLDYVKEHQIDVFYTSPPQVNSLCSYIRKFGKTDRVGYLLSVTGERLLPEDAAFLLDGGYFDHICDHMRCWDGGATFFTCKHRNYHLMDNLAWCEEGPNHELICTDYFNLASPFVRYWNGDYCRIAKEYQRCECGRLYRDFEFLESRPFSLKGTNMREIQEKIRALGIPGIKQVRCSVHDLSVVSTRELADGEKDMIRSVSDKFQFRFICEPF